MPVEPMQVSFELVRYTGAALDAGLSSPATLTLVLVLAFPPSAAALPPVAVDVALEVDCALALLED